MLKFFRQKLISKIIFWSLVVLVLPAFVLWGTGSIGRSGPKGPKFVGMIENRKVTYEDLARSIAAIRCHIILNYFRQEQILDALLKNAPFLAKGAWDRLITLRQAEKEKITVSDKEVIAYIRNHPLFVRSGAFDERLYAYILRYNMGLDARAFEEIVRENLAIQELKDRVTKDVAVSDEDVAAAYRKENIQYTIAYILFDTKNYLDKVTVDDALVKAYYDENRSHFALPKKEGSDEPSYAGFDDVKAGIRDNLAEEDAKALALAAAGEAYEPLAAAAKKDGFEKAAAKTSLKIVTSKPFIRSGYLEGIGEAAGIADAAAGATSGTIVGPVAVRRGAIIFTVTATQAIDEEKFKTDKEEFAKKILNEKKMQVLEGWFKGIAASATLNLDFADIEQYLR